MIRAFTAAQPEQSLSDVARNAGLSRATARRFLLTVVELGYVRTDGKRFALAPRVLQLGFGYLSGLSLLEVATPHLEQLSRLLGESTSASVLDGADIVYVARVPARRIMAVAITVGTRFPAYATSMGRVLLAGLPDATLRLMLENPAPVAFTSRTVVDPHDLRDEIIRVRDRGWATVDQELELGLRSFAAPVHQGGDVVAAINISTTADATLLADAERAVVPALIATARAISDDLALTTIS